MQRVAVLLFLALCAGCLDFGSLKKSSKDDRESDAGQMTDSGAGDASLGREYAPVYWAPDDDLGEPNGSVVLETDDNDKNIIVVQTSDQPSSFRTPGLTRELFENAPDDENVLPLEVVDVLGTTVVLVWAKDFRVDADVTIRALGKRPLAIVAEDTIDIAGVIDVGAYYERKGAGASDDVDPSSVGGATNSIAGGGAGGSNSTLGGAGGAKPGTPGSERQFPSAIVGGSAGGAGTVNGIAASSSAGAGGGGGALLLSAETIKITGTVSSGGGGGLRGGSTGKHGGGGGGGSGGALFFEAPNIQVRISAIVGTPGGGGGSSSWGNGAAGRNGRAGGIRAAGGSSGASWAGGGQGTGADEEATGGGTETGLFNVKVGGGGGGGAGYVFIHGTKDGVDIHESATFDPLRSVKGAVKVRLDASPSN